MGKRTRAAAAFAAASTSSLSNFLLKEVEGQDSDLNDIFSNSLGPTKAYKGPKKEKKSKKDKTVEIIEPVVEPVVEEEEEVEEVANDAELSEADSNESLGLDSDDDDGVEEAYAARITATRLKALAEGGNNKRKADNSGDEENSDDFEDEDDEEEDEEELDIDNLMHESLLPKAIYKEVKATAKDLKKAKVVKARAESTETPEERDARTIFLGNVPVGCSTSVPMKKALIRHVLTSPQLLSLLPSNCPPLKASSIRFRSLAFASTVFGRKADTVNAEGEPIEPGGRGRKRAKEWRESEGTDERGVRGGFRHKEPVAPVVPVEKEKRGALTDGQKRRVAFIRGELNEGKKACNAYLVLEPLPASYTILPLADLLRSLVAATDGSVFESFTLRADHVRPRSSAATTAAANLTSKPSKAEMNSLAPPNTGPSYTVPPAEARRTIFMGGLDFAENEENIRDATEKILIREKGESGATNWVESVRIIRDASTGLGKGFGYVLLRDAGCVDELLALPVGQPLKITKRKVRLERCKTGVAAARAKASAAARDIKIAAASASGSNTTVKSGITGPSFPADPRPRMTNRPTATESQQHLKIAEALAKLSSGERKELKAIDPERLMRRAEKKKSKVLGERYERKQANNDKINGILGKESKFAERKRKEKKRVHSTLKGGKRFTGMKK